MEAYHSLQHKRRALVQQARKTFGQHVLLMPTTPLTARPIAEADETIIPYSRFTRFANCLDFCAITIPVATSKSKLPIGLQAMMTIGNNSILLDFSEIIENTRID